MRAASSPRLAQEVGLHRGWKRCGSARRAPAGRRPQAPARDAAPAARDRGGGPGWIQPGDRLLAGARAAIKGRCSASAQAPTGSPAPCAWSRSAWAGARPQSRSATCGRSEMMPEPGSTRAGSSRAVHPQQRQGPAQQPLGDGAVVVAEPQHAAAPELRSRILRRSSSAWRFCRLIARWLCGLVSCTPVSSPAWRSKKPWGVLARNARCRPR